MGEIPEWYLLARAARYWNVAPWELAEQPLIWLEWALASERAEGSAQSESKRHATRKQKQK